MFSSPKEQEEERKQISKINSEDANDISNLPARIFAKYWILMALWLKIYE